MVKPNQSTDNAMQNLGGVTISFHGSFGKILQFMQ